MVLLVTTLCSVCSPNKVELSYWYKAVRLAMDHTLALSNSSSKNHELDREIIQVYKLVNTILKSVDIGCLLEHRLAQQELHLFSETEVNRLHVFRSIKQFLVEQEQHWENLHTIDREATKMEGKLMRGQSLTWTENKSMEQSEEEYRSQQALQDDVQARKRVLELDFVYDKDSGSWKQKVVPYKTVLTTPKGRMGRPVRSRRRAFLEDLHVPDHLVYYDNDDYLKLIDFIRSRVPLDSTAVSIKLRQELQMFRTQFAHLALQNAVHIPSVTEEYNNASIVSLALDLSHEWKLQIHTMHRAINQPGSAMKRTRLIYGEKDEEDEDDGEEDEDEEEEEDDGEEEDITVDDDTDEEDEEQKAPNVDTVAELRLVADIEKQGRIAYAAYLPMIRDPTEYTATADYRIRNQLVSDIVAYVNAYGIYTPNIRRCIEDTVHSVLVKMLDVDGDGDLARDTARGLVAKVEKQIASQSNVKKTIKWVNQVHRRKMNQREKEEKEEESVSNLYADELDMAFAEFGMDVLDVFYTRLEDFKSGHVDSVRVQSDVSERVISHITKHLRVYNLDVHLYLVDQLGILMFSHLVFPTNAAQRALLETSVDTAEFRFIYDMSAQWVFHRIEKYLSPTLFDNGFESVAPKNKDVVNRPSFRGVPLIQDTKEERRLRQQHRRGLLVDSGDESETDTTTDEDDERPRRFRRLKKNTK